eukprot:gene9793-13175_t
MEEFDELVGQICSSSSSYEIRSSAEQRLLVILSDINLWKIYLSYLLLDNINDTIRFFICIGLQRLIWKYWGTGHTLEFSNDDKMRLTNTIIQTLTQKNMQAFAKSKVEQVLGIICASSYSLEPVLGLLVDANSPGAFTGLSAIKTVLELILSDDPKLFPEQKVSLLIATQNILVPLTNLACSACSVALQVNNDENFHMMLVSLELLKLAISKLQIGPHISADVVTLLFSIAELGADRENVYHRAAISSIEVLTEIMNKRYLPPSPLIQNNIDSSSNNPFNRKEPNSNLSVLLDIVVKLVSLLKKYRMTGNVDDSPIMLSLLEFITVFAESHLERCISISSQSNSISSSISSTSSGSGFSAASIELLNQSVTVFFEELVAMTTMSSEPQILNKIVSVWNRVVNLEAVKEMLLTQSSVCLSITSHLLQSSLIQTNSHLETCIEELIEDFHVDPLVDPHIKELVMHLEMQNSINGNKINSPNSPNIDGNASPDLQGEVEAGFIGTSLLTNITNLFAELVLSPDVSLWLNQTVTQLVHQYINILSSNISTSIQKSAAAVDLCFLTRLLPMITSNQSQLLIQLINLAVQMVSDSFAIIITIIILWLLSNSQQDTLLLLEKSLL